MKKISISVVIPFLEMKENNLKILIPLILNEIKKIVNLKLI